MKLDVKFFSNIIIATFVTLGFDVFFPRHPKYCESSLMPNTGCELVILRLRVRLGR